MKNKVNRRIASLLLCLTICIQNTACMAIQNNNNPIDFTTPTTMASSSVTKNDEEDVTSTLQFFYDELSKIDGIDSRISFNDEQIAEILEPTFTIDCSDTTEWTEETLYAQIVANTKEYEKNNTSVHSVFDNLYLYKISQDDDDSINNLKIQIGIENGIAAVIKVALENNDRHQIHQFSKLRIVINDNLNEKETADITLAHYVNEDNLIEISPAAIKEAFAYSINRNGGLFLTDAAKKTIMHEMNHAKEWACQDQLDNGKKPHFSTTSSDFSFMLEANAENDLYYGNLKEHNPANFDYENTDDMISYTLLKSYYNYCQIENLLLCINAWDNQSNASDFYQAIFNNDLDRLYQMLNINTDEEKVLLNKIMYSIDALQYYNDYIDKIAEKYNIPDGDLSDEDYFLINDTIGTMQYVDIMKLSLKNLINYNETQADLTLEDNLNLYKILLYSITSRASYTKLDDNLNTTDYYFYQEFNDSLKQVERIFFTYLSQYYNLTLEEVINKYYGYDLETSTTTTQKLYGDEHINSNDVDNLVKKFPKLETLNYPSSETYKAMENAFDGNEYYESEYNDNPIKLNIRFSKTN